MHKILNRSSRKWLIAAGGALAAVAVIVLASHGVAHPAGGGTAAMGCQPIKYQPGQPIVLARVDGTASTGGGALRTQYAKALSTIAEDASKEGAYLIVDVFGSTIGDVQTICATSTRVAGAAPIFVTAQRTALRKTLDAVAERASRVNMGASGSSIYGALVDAIQRVQTLRGDRPVSASIVLITDGDEAADGVHLRRLLRVASDEAITEQIIGRLPTPNAHGLSSIQLEGIGRNGVGKPISTRAVRRMEDIWTRVCNLTHPRRCVATAELLSHLS